MVGKALPEEAFLNREDRPDPYSSILGRCFTVAWPTKMDGDSQETAPRQWFWTDDNDSVQCVANDRTLRLLGPMKVIG